MAQAQIRLVVVSNYIGQEGARKKGDVFTTDDTNRARFLIERGLCRLWVQPRETKPDGPDETQIGGPAEGKSSGVPTIGRSTDTPSSSAPGPTAPSSSSPAVPASRVGRSRRSKLGGLFTPRGGG
jgi:hypothetical protein